MSQIQTLLIFWISFNNKLTTMHDHCIICGDLNLILDPLKDSYNYRHLNNPRARNTVLEIMNTRGFFDVFRYENNDLVRYTWRRKNPFRQTRLDYFIISDNLKDLINSCSIKPGYRSDHSIIQLEILMCVFVKVGVYGNLIVLC